MDLSGTLRTLVGLIPSGTPWCLTFGSTLASPCLEHDIVDGSPIPQGSQASLRPEPNMALSCQGSIHYTCY